jgi:hypothetical protein
MVNWVVVKERNRVLELFEGKGVGKLAWILGKWYKDLQSRLPQIGQVLLEIDLTWDVPRLIWVLEAWPLVVPFAFVLSPESYLRRILSVEQPSMWLTWQEIFHG